MQVIRDVRELELSLGLSLGRYFPEAPNKHASIFVSEVCRNLASAIKRADPLAIQDACALIELDPQLPFGKLVKSDIARSLRKSAQYIAPNDRARITKSTAALLSLEYCPREVEDYCKLVKGLGNREVAEVLATVCALDPKSLKLVAYLEAATQHGGQRDCRGVPRDYPVVPARQRVT